jgi:hypothetical protein
MGLRGILGHFRAKPDPVRAPRFFQHDLRDRFGNDRSNHISYLGGRAYFVKTSYDPLQAKTAHLAYLLARSAFNVPEVRMLSDADAERHITVVQRRPRANPLRRQIYVHLCRLCQDYSVASLPIQDLTHAVAAEIAFSLWIGRRDAHNFNRCYIGGIPMFFDFGGSFGLNDTSGTVSRRDGNSASCLPWRLWQAPRQSRLTTRNLRRLDQIQHVAVHPVEGVDLFWFALDAYIDHICAEPSASIAQAIESCAFPARDAATLRRLLVLGRRDLGAKVLELRRRLEFVHA